MKVSHARFAFALASLALAGFALVATDCTIDAFCENGAVGCAADRCANRKRDGDETDVDCGGSCGACASGAKCASAADCASQRCLDGACCEPPCVLNAQRFGGPAYDRIAAAAYLPDGALVVTGEMHTGFDLGDGPMTSAGGTDVFVAAFETDGTLRWKRQFGGTKEDGQPVLATTPSGHVWIAGIYQAKLNTGAGTLSNSGGYSDLFFIELGTDGATLQAKGLNSQATSVSIGAISVTDDGGLLILGTLGRLDFGDGTVLISKDGPFPGGPSDVYVAKLDANLHRVWHQQLGDSQNDFPFALARDAAGHVVVGVNSVSTTDFGGGPLDRAGTVVLSFSETDGAYQSGRSYGGGIHGQTLSIDDDGHAFLMVDLDGEADLGTGKLVHKGSPEAIVARLTDAGDIAWLTRMPSDIGTVGLAVKRDPSGGLFTALSVTGDLSLGDVTASTGADSLVFVRLDDGGAVEWARNVGGITLGTSVGITSTPGGDVLVFGGYGGTSQLGALPPADGPSDAFIATLLP